MTDVAVTLGTITDNSNAVFPDYNNSFEGFITEAFAAAAASTFTPTDATPCSPTNVSGALIGLIGAVGVGGGVNPNNFSVGLQGALPQDYFDSVTFTAGGDEPGSHTLNSADAVYNGADTSATGFTTWVFPSIGGAGELITPLGSTVTFHNVATLPTLVLAVPTVIDGTGVLLEWTPGNLGDLDIVSFDVFRDDENVAAGLEADVLEYSDQTNTTNTTFTYFIRMHMSDGSTVDSNTEDVTTSDETAEFNCDCETVSAYSTLAQLRVRMAIQCGYAAMSANLPTGQAVEFNEYLLSAQKQLYYKFRAQRTERFFKWQMVPGQRYYGLADSESDSCALKLDPLAITWVGFEDLNRAWYRLIEGIDPVYYTRANINFGWPTRYEIRSCIEVFPAPQAAYTLWIKGDIGLAPFSADADRPTFDEEAILLFAVANWKSAKGRQDADRCMGQATQRIQDLTARKHGTARYVPSTYVQNPATPPRFLPLGSQQS